MIGDPSNQEYYSDDPIQVKDQTLLSKTFFWMFLGLLGTAGVAAYSYFSGLLLGMVQSGFFNVLIFIELAVVLIFSLLFRKMSPTVVGIMYFVYSFINGLTFSTIFFAYDLSSIVYVFFVTAGIYGVLALYGYKTKKDLSSWGTFLFAMLFGGTIITFINLFLGNPTIYLFVDIILLAVFFGVTIYDVNRIKAYENDPDLDQEKLPIYCAMQLYLDFINIFLRILAIFGKRKD